MNSIVDIAGKSIGFIGAGNMAEAIVRGIVSAGILPLKQVTVSDPSSDRRAVFSDMGVNATDDNACAAASDMVFIAVKPQVLDNVLSGVSSSFKSGAVVISIAAGIRTDRLEKILPGEVKVVRVMPNTPMLVGKGVCGVCSGSGAGREELDLAMAILNCAGISREVPEDLMDAVTALSGSGPAYFFRFVEALAGAGVKAGLPADLAAEFARNTFVGSANLLENTGESPAALRERVTSPGGTTAAALAIFNEKLDAVVNEAVDAACKRSVELAAGK